MGEPDSQSFEDQPEVFFGRIGNCASVIWRKTPTVNAAELAARHFGEIETTPGHGFALIAVVTSNCAPVSADVRQAFDSAMRACRDSVMGMAAVIEVQGVLGGLTRAMARTMSIVARSPYPTNTYATVDAASQWLANISALRGAPPLDPREISAFVERNRHHR